METLGDYGSLLQIGFELNIVSSYLTIFINPAVTRAHAEIDRFRVWVTSMEISGGEERDQRLDEARDILSSWEQRHGALERLTGRLQRIPIFVAICAAVLCAIALAFPSAAAPPLPALWSLIIAFAPAVGGSAYIWKNTTVARAEERKVAAEARRIVLLKA